MPLVRLYGRRALVLTDAKNVYRSQNGVLDVPPGPLVQRAIEQGYSRVVPADLAIDEDDDTAPVVEPLAPVASSAAPLPPDHPQSTTERVQEARQQERAKQRAEEEARQLAKANAPVPPAPSGAPQQTPLGARRPGR